MDRLTHAAGSICFILLSNLVNGDDFLEKTRKKYSKTPMSVTTVVLLAVGLPLTVLVACCAFFWAVWYYGRQRALAAMQSGFYVPPTLGPAPIPSPVMSGAPTCSHPEAYPLIPGTSTSLTTLNTQQKGFQEERSPLYPKDGFYSDYNSSSLPQLPTATMSSAPPQPLPPYGN
ncbi:uncharacterized protein [Dermacentor andersoni]|uniref:uncharacterized protein isoform X1 n=1 Tax=Dermacentor andersoni TaxID=34620 RepID=UPI0024164CF8|nr:uncharacterized protein LOC129380231 isoform X1 [Dermacentor andersoni]